LNLCTVDDIYGIVLSIGNWFSGATGMNNYAPSLQTRDLRYFRLIHSLQQEKLPSIVYRFSKLKIENANKKVGKSIAIVTGSKNLQSWTTDHNYPKIFFEKFYSHGMGGNLRNDKRFEPCVISTVPSKRNYCASTEECIAFFETALKLIEHATKEQDPNKNKSLAKYACNKLIKRLNSNFIKQQKEVVLFS